jgi:hypothetical protein
VGLCGWLGIYKSKRERGRAVGLDEGRVRVRLAGWGSVGWLGRLAVEYESGEVELAGEYENEDGGLNVGLGLGRVVVWRFVRTFVEDVGRGLGVRIRMGVWLVLRRNVSYVKECIIRKGRSAWF